MSVPKLIILDRDGTINVSSKDEKSPYYYIGENHHFIIKPGVKEALAIINGLQIPTVMATKQRCIGKGLITRERVDIIHSRLERLMDFDFQNIYIEPNEETKMNLYKKILADYPRINPQDIWFFDDSEGEQIIAARLGITTFNGANLYDSLTKALKLT